MAKAMVIICPHRPDLFGQPLLGHVAWGYEYPDGSWCIGAVEGTEWQQGNKNGFWVRHMPDLRSSLMHFAQGKKTGNEYDYYKFLTVTNGVVPDWKYADQVVAWVRDQDYNLFGRNCMNSAYDVLRSFAGGKGYYNNAELPLPDHNWIPNGWFNAIQTPEYYQLPTVVHAFQSQARSPGPAPIKLMDNPPTPEWRVGEKLPTEQPKWKAVDVPAPKEAAPVE